MAVTAAVRPDASPLRRRRLRAGWALGVRYAARLRESRRDRVILAILAALAADVAALGHLTEDYLTGDPLVDWDVRFSVWLHAHSNGSLVSAFEVVTYAGNAVVMAVLVALAAVVLVRRRLVNEALLLGFVFVASELVNAAMKLAFHRPRPELAFVHLDTYSFPSGHATASAAVYLTLAAIVVPRIGSLRRRIAVVAAAVLVVAVVAFSRLYLEVHYLSDVLTGLTIGCAWALVGALALLVFERADFSRALPAPLRRIVLR